MKGKERSVNEWMSVFSALYSEADRQRTPEQMWIAVMAHASSIGENIRKFTFESLLDSAAHTFCWLCSFVDRCNKVENDIFSISDSLCGIVSLKYPRLCGHCQANPCKCEPVKIEEEKDKSAQYKDLLILRDGVLDSFEGYSIEDFQKMFRKIYSARSHIQTLESIGFHFLEEIGETAICVRKASQLRNVAQDVDTKIDSAFLKEISTVRGTVENYMEYWNLLKRIDYASRDPKVLKARLVDAKMGLIGEIGDSFSWFCAVLNKLESISESIWDHPESHEKPKPLEEVLNIVYFDPSTGKARCPSCNTSPCTCAFYNLGGGK